MQCGELVLCRHRQWQSRRDGPTVLLVGQPQQFVEYGARLQRSGGSAIGFDAGFRRCCFLAIEFQPIEVTRIEEALGEIGGRAAGGGERCAQFEDRNGAHMPVIRALYLCCQIEQLGSNLVLRARQFSARPALAWREIK